MSHKVPSEIWKVWCHWFCNGPLHKCACTCTSDQFEVQCILAEFYNVHVHVHLCLAFLVFMQLYDRKEHVILLSILYMCKCTLKCSSSVGLLMISFRPTAFGAGGSDGVSVWSVGEWWERGEGRKEENWELWGCGEGERCEEWGVVPVGVVWGCDEVWAVSL